MDLKSLGKSTGPKDPRPYLRKSEAFGVLATHWPLTVALNKVVLYKHGSVCISLSKVSMVTFYAGEAVNADAVTL